MSYQQPPVHPAFHPVNRQETSTNSNHANMCHSRPSSPPAYPQHGSIDMTIDQIPLFSTFNGNDDSASTLQSDLADQHPHPLLTNNNYGSRKMDDDIDNHDDGRAAFSAAATDVSGSQTAKGHKRGDTFEPLPFQTSEDVAGMDGMAAKAYVSQRDNNDVVGYRQPYAGQQIQMQVYPPYRQEPSKFGPSSPNRTQPPITSHAHTEDQMFPDNSNKGHRKVPSFVTPLRGYDDVMIEDGKAAPEHQAYGGYEHHGHGHHGYYPPYHLWQNQYGGAGHAQYHQHGPYRQQPHQQDAIPHPPPAPPIFHPLADDEGGPTSKHTIKRRYFRDNRRDGPFATPVPASAAAPAYHRPPLPSHGPIHHYNEQDSDIYQGQATHRRGPSIIFDNDEDWHQQSPTVLYRSWSTGGSSTTTVSANVGGDADPRLRAPKKKSKKKSVTKKKKRKSKSTFTASSDDDDMPPLPSLHTTNDDNIGINEADGSESDDDAMVSDLDMDLPLESLVNFQKMMTSSETTQKALEKWDKKMGLKRSHSKTMWVSCPCRSIVDMV